MTNKKPVVVRARLLKLWIQTRESYWFFPSVMAVSAVVFSFFTTAIDARLDTDWPENIPFVYSNQPDGARALLATVAGSMITVTGITFSLTLLAVSHATGQFGPRLLTNFMRDRGNQITLGTFVATFLYCLMVLRTVRNAEEPATASDPVNEPLGAFVPHISVLTAILFTVASVGVLIYFIHHIPESIRLSNVVARIGRELLSMIPELFPESIAHDHPATATRDPRRELPDHFVELATEVPADADGYVQAIDEKGIVESAKQHDLIIQLCARPGDFVSRGQTLVLVSPSEKIDDEVRGQLQAAFAQGAHRTSAQNALFLVDQLVEVASRALSPGVNDPMTAMTCIDWLQSVLIQLTQREPPDSCRFDDSGQLRIIAEPVTFGEFCESIFDQLRPYFAGDRNAALHMLRMIENVVAAAHKEDQREVLIGYAHKLVKAAEARCLPETELQELKKCLDVLHVPQDISS